uniref:RNA-directed RNA polymerase n=1 Tax=Erysiphales associated totivirus 15 TaxID=2719844 RepID=A0A6G9ELP8_9VIRU|nr:RNA-dependent RNA polymerase [Erysiphales associated totivirus 15]
MYTADHNDATWILLDILDARCIKGMFWHNYEAAAVKVLSVYYPALNASALYINKDDYLFSYHTGVLARLSRIEFGPLLFPYGNINEQEVINTLMGKRTISPVQAAREYKANNAFLKKIEGDHSMLPNVRAGANHMKHISLTMLFKIGTPTILKQCNSAVTLLRRLHTYSQDNVTQAFFIGLLTWMYVLPQEYNDLIRDSYIWYMRASNTIDWASKVKRNFSMKCKALQNTVQLDLSPFFELEVLVNRGIGEINWEQEKVNRTQPQLAKFNENEVYSETINMFKEVRRLGALPKCIEWQDFWDMRWSWTTTGAYHSQHEEDMVYNGDVRGLKNKFYAFNRMPNDYYKNFVTREPEIYAWPSVKNEWGKQRAIYGVDITSYTHESLGFIGCEELLENMFPIASAGEEKIVHSHVKEAIKNGLPYCFDYEDFNSQHSTSSMQAIMAAYRDTFADVLSNDQIESINWVIRAQEKTIVKDNGGTYKTEGTLMSGCRLTTFINTVLNYIYIKIMTKGDLIKSLHSGDDVLTTVTTYSQLQSLKAGAERHNVRFQESKCVFAAVTEFLRVDHKQAMGAQYLARGVATFTHSPLENVMPKDSVEHCKALITRANEVIDRKGDENKVKQILAAQLDKIKDKQKFDGDIHMLTQIHITRGGVCDDYTKCNPDYRVYTKDITLLDPGGTDQEKVERFRTEKLPGVSRYTEVICDKYLEGKYKPVISRLVRKAVYKPIDNIWTRAEIKMDRSTEYEKVCMQQHKMYKNMKVGMKANLSKAFGVPIVSPQGSDAKIAKLLDGVGDKIKALRAWF